MNRHFTRAVLLCFCLGVGPGIAAAPDGASETDQLLFEDRDWSSAGQVMTWSVEETAPKAEGFRPLKGGRLLLTDALDASDGKPMLQLREIARGRDRIVGTYPLSVDPLLIYFLETTTRHMAAIAGGNPDYIRNRIKAALRGGGAVIAGSDSGRTVNLSPFVNDRNAHRMGGFETLTMTISLAPDANAPIRAFQAAAPAAGYRLDIVGEQP